MAEKNIYIIRHGETDFNKSGIIQGKLVDSDLNETGREQARKFFEMYGMVKFDKIYTSTLKRTAQSVDNFIRKGIPHEKLPGLDELSWGIYDGLFPADSLKPSIRRILKKWEKGYYNTKAYMGESPQEVSDRVLQAWHYIQQQPDEKNVLVATHGRSLRLLLCHIHNEPISSMTSFGHHNMCLYQIRYDGDFSEPTVLLSNDVRHLG